MPSLLCSLQGCGGSRPWRWRQEDTTELGGPSRGRCRQARSQVLFTGRCAIPSARQITEPENLLLSFFPLLQAVGQEEEAWMPSGDKHKVTRGTPRLTVYFGGGVHDASFPRGS